MSHLQKPPTRDKPPCFRALPLAVALTLAAMIRHPRKVWRMINE